MVAVGITEVALAAKAVVERWQGQCGRTGVLTRGRLVRWLNTGRGDLGRVVRDIRRLRRMAEGVQHGAA